MFYVSDASTNMYLCQLGEEASKEIEGEVNLGASESFRTIHIL